MNVRVSPPLAAPAGPDAAHSLPEKIGCGCVFDTTLDNLLILSTEFMPDCCKMGRRRLVKSDF
jgi:hypothetical protein